MKQSNSGYIYKIASGAHDLSLVNSALAVALKDKQKGEIFLKRITLNLELDGAVH